MLSMRTLMCGVAAAMLATSANAVVLYQNNFDGNEATHTGVTGSFSGLPTEAASVGAWNAAGWAGNYGASRATGDPAPFTGLYLSNLATHTTISASFILGFLESWDSNDNGLPFSPDNLEIWIDGTKMADLTYNNALGSVKATAGGTVLFEYVQANGNGYFSDTLVDMGTASFLTFAHTASTLALEFRASGGGWQGGSDEGYGLDNVVLTYDGVRSVGPGIPEPATWALMIGGFGMAGAALRRRRTLAA